MSVTNAYLDDEEVRIDDGQERHVVDEKRIDEDVASAEPVLGQVVRTAGGHVTFWDIPVPSYHGKDSPDGTEQPDTENPESSAFVGQWLG